MSSNDNLKQIITIKEHRNKWYQKFIDLENNRFECRFGEILSKLFTPTQIDLILHPKKKVYRWTAEDISSAITLRSTSPKAYRYLKKKTISITRLIIH